MGSNIRRSAAAAGRARGLAACLLALVVALPAEAQEQDVDPIEPVNRKIYAFNDVLDTWLLRPVAKGYDRVFPDPVKRGIRNVFSNAGTPAVAVNQFLQGKPREGFSDLGRFVMNTTVGLGGLFDVATPTGLRRHEEDFGQTFARWGAGNGVFLMLPFRGPSTTTHVVGMVFDAFTNPIALISPDRDRYLVVVLNVVDGRAQLLSSEELISGDEYLFLRDAYLQRRSYLIQDGAMEDDPFLDDEFEDYQ